MLNYLYYLYLFSVVLSHAYYLPHVFKKVGIAPWKGSVPFYNLWFLQGLLQKPKYWFIANFFPGVQLFFWIGLGHDLARQFDLHKTKDVLLAMFLPQWGLHKIAFDPSVVFVGKCDWDNAELRQRRRISDYVVLTIITLGAGIVFVLWDILNKQPRKPQKPSLIKEWIDSVGFAMIAAAILRVYLLEMFMIPTGSMERNLRIGDFLVASKMSYGIKLPNTPLSYPVFHNTIPYVKLKSYTEVGSLPYMRLWQSPVKRGEAVVFHFPAGDTAVIDPDYYQGHNYHQLLRSLAVEFWQHQGGQGDFFDKQNAYIQKARNYFEETYGITYRPVDKRENYVKRCVAIAGDTVSVRAGKVYINGVLAESEHNENIQWTHAVWANKRLPTKYFKDELDVYEKDVQEYALRTGEYKYVMPLGKAQKDKLAKNKAITNIQNLAEVKPHKTEQDFSLSIFPNDKNYHWTVDDFGALYLPKKGDTIALNDSTVILYKRAIVNYEHNTLEKKAEGYFLNGEPANAYVFKYNYYWMMGDNRHNSADSRSWGYVAEDHVVGKPLFVWFSKDPEKSWLNGLRFNRFLISAQQ